LLCFVFASYVLYPIEMVLKYAMGLWYSTTNVTDDMA
jgi:hypothetical protein